MSEFIKFIEKDNSNSNNSNKHYLDDELVQTSFENLIKKPKTDSTKVETITNGSINCSINCSVTAGGVQLIYWIEVNNKTYKIDKQKLDELEPNTLLLNINKVDFNTKFDDKTNTLIYLDKLDYFDLIFDYLQGYTVENIQYIFNGYENNFDDNLKCKQISILKKFIVLIIKLKMYNLLDKIYNIYSYIHIYNFKIICNRNTMNKIEPSNTLLQPQYKLFNSQQCFFYHNRDVNIFKKYFMKYILGLQDLKTTITQILIIRDTPEHQNKQEKQYEFHKVLNDIEYYKFNNLFNKIKQFI